MSRKLADTFSSVMRILGGCVSSASKSILRFGTDPKLLGWYVDVSKGSGLLDPVNFMTCVLLVLAQLYAGGVIDENVYGKCW